MSKTNANNSTTLISCHHLVTQMGSRILLVVLPQRIYFQIMRYERVIFVILLAAVWAGVLDGVLGTFNDVVWDLLDLGTGYIDQIAYSAYYATIGTVI